MNSLTKMAILLLFTPPNVIPKLYNIHSSVQHTHTHTHTKEMNNLAIFNIMKVIGIWAVYLQKTTLWKFHKINLCSFFQMALFQVYYIYNIWIFVYLISNNYPKN